MAQKRRTTCRQDPGVRAHSSLGKVNLHLAHPYPQEAAMRRAAKLLYHAHSASSSLDSAMARACLILSGCVHQAFWTRHHEAAPSTSLVKVRSVPLHPPSSIRSLALSQCGAPLPLGRLLLHPRTR